MFVQASFSEAARQDPDLKVTVDKTIDHVNKIIEKTRRLSAGLSPSTLEILGLSTAIKTLVKDYESLGQFRIKLTISNLDHTAFQGDGINIYRIIQEALNNILKHADASLVEIGFRKKRNQIELFISDNGCGFDVARTSEFGLGLSTMRERVVILGGTFQLESVESEGTRIRIMLPVTKNEQ
ncbi:MAG: hypothetical protein K8I00_12340, partial [Candidatus Omnitrophica bacterium]|nr:hypothetical protein [Candidatus Omnitrophota bacterium]